MSAKWTYGSPGNYAEWIDKLEGAGLKLGQRANRASPTRGKGNIPPVFRLRRRYLLSGLVSAGHRPI